MSDVLVVVTIVQHLFLEPRLDNAAKPRSSDVHVVPLAELLAQLMNKPCLLLRFPRACGRLVPEALGVPFGFKCLGAPFGFKCLGASLDPDLPNPIC